jgi:hypothetical protein
VRNTVLLVTALLLTPPSAARAADTITIPADSPAVPPRPLLPQADFYVAPGGSDSNPGTAAAPLATLAKARDKVREMAAAGLAHDVVVVIRGGTYRQTETIVFGPRDSGTEKHSITYAACPGEKVVLSGGRTISGWTKSEGEIWTTEIPEAKTGKWYFRQLFVGGRRAVRARTPNWSEKNFVWWRIKTSTATNSEPPARDATIVAGVDHPIKAWKNASDVELVSIDNNEGGRRRLGSIDEAAQTFTIPPPQQSISKIFECDWRLSIPAAGKACYLENARELLDEPGEWYLDRGDGMLSYWPRPGEDMTRPEAVAPVVQKTLLSVAGTPARPVRNLHFQGIRVEHVDWPLPAAGYHGVFGCLVITEGDKPIHRWMDAAVAFEHARSCSFTDGGIAHAGGIGLCLLRGTSHVAVEGNEIGDLGGGGIAGGGIRNRSTLQWNPPPEEGHYVGYRIANNHVHDCGLGYYGAVGIFFGLVQNAVIAHNLVHDTAYTGLVLCGNEDPALPFARDNLVEYNHVHHVMKVTVDGSGIYLSFPQAGWGAVVRGNLFHDTGHGAAVYFDPVGRAHGCAGYRLEGNVFGHTGHPMYGSPEAPCFDNLIQPGDGAVSRELMAAMEAVAGLEPAYRRSLLGIDEPPRRFYRLTAESRADNVWSAWQLDWPGRGEGVVQVFRRAANKQDSERLKLRDLAADARYEVRNVGAKTVSEHAGRELVEEGLLVQIPKPGQAATIAYKRLAMP